MLLNTGNWNGTVPVLEFTAKHQLMFR